MVSRTFSLGGLSVGYCSGVDYCNLEFDWTSRAVRAAQELAELRARGLVPPDGWDGYRYEGPNEAGHRCGCICQDCWELDRMLEAEFGELWVDELFGPAQACNWCGEKNPIGAIHPRDGWICLRTSCINAELARRAPRGLSGIAALAVGRFLDEEELPAFERADGSLSCPVCTKPYRDHPFHSAHDHLRVLCDGRLVKL
jgi:hypothetical protein